MSNYAATYPEIFTGRTGKALRDHPAEARELLLYLICGPLKNGWGLYTVSVGHMTHDTGRAEAVVRDSIERLRALGVIEYDSESEWVWVREMARFQFQLPLKPNDFRIRSAKKWYERLPEACPFLGQWWDRYHEDLHFLADAPPGPVARRGPRPRGMEAPPKGLCAVPVVVPDVVVQKPDVPKGEVLPARKAAGAPPQTFALEPPSILPALSNGAEPPVKRALDYFCELYAAANGGKKYIVAAGKDPGLLSRLIKQVGLDEVLDTMRLLYTSSDDQVAKSARDIGALYFHFNRLRQAPRRPSLNPANARILETRKRLMAEDADE